MDYATALRQGNSQSEQPPQDGALMRYLKRSGEALGRIPSDLYEMGVGGAAQGAAEAAAGVGVLPPGLGAGARAGAEMAGNAVQAAPKLSSALLGTLGVTAAPSEAGETDPLMDLYSQRAALNQRLQPAVQRREANRPRNRVPNAKVDVQFFEADGEVKNLEAQISGVTGRIDAETKKNSPEERARIKQELALKEANTPFREKHPTLSSALAGGGVAAATVVPFLLRGKANLGTFAPGSTAGRIAGSADDLTAAIGKNDSMAATLSAKNLDELAKTEPGKFAGPAKEVGKTAAASGSGGALAAELSMVPDQLDAALLPEGEAKDAAWGRITDPNAYKDRAIVGALGGLSGYKIGDIVPKRTPDFARARSMSSILKDDFGSDLSRVKTNLGLEAPSAAKSAGELPHWARQTRNRGQFGPYPASKKKK